MCYHKVLDEGFYYRYANDILRWTSGKHLLLEPLPVFVLLVMSICEHQIEAEREEMLDTIKDILDNTINWYISWVEERMSSVMPGFSLPKVELAKLPLELYWIPQIEGETEAIRVDLTENRINRYGVQHPVFLYLCYYILMDAFGVHTTQTRLFKELTKWET